LYSAFPFRPEGPAGYEDYFLSRRKWFFGILATTFVADVIDTSLKGSTYLHSFGIEYPIRITINLTLCVIGMFTSNRRVQLALLAVALLYHISLIVTLYSTIQ